MDQKVFTVSELTFAIKRNLESDYRELYLQGEVSNFKAQSSGHFYFSLKDANAQISAAIFKNNARNQTRLPKDGDQIRVRGELSVYPPRGTYMIVVREVFFLGLGELLLLLQERKEKIQKLGWTDPKRKKPLPKFPKRIGVVTSPTGAVIQDIIHVLKRRFSTFHLILNPVKVQGEGAALEIANAIRDFNRYELADLLIVGRGGGSLEDLWAFNEEIVAKAIFESKIPIISAVGHETDVTLADLVADVRAPTPSAAAEIACKEKTELLKSLNNYHSFAKQAIVSKLYLYNERLRAIKKQPPLLSPFTLLSGLLRAFDEQKTRMKIFSSSLLEKKLRLDAKKQTHRALHPRLHLQKAANNLHLLRNRLFDSLFSLLRQKRATFQKNLLLKRLIFSQKKILEQKRERLLRLISHLFSLDPKALIKKGYSILFSKKDGSLILSINQVKDKEGIMALLSDGTLSLTVEKQ